MIEKTGVRITLGLWLWLAAGLAALGWQLQQLLESAGQNGASRAALQQSLALLLLGNLVVLGAGVALIVRVCVSAPLGSLRDNLAAFRAAGAEGGAGLVPLTGRRGDFNQVGLHVNFLLNRLNEHRYGAETAEAPARRRQQSRQQYAD